MIDIGKIPWNGLRVASTFAGCGGSSLGYRMAGYRVLWASEFVEAARKVYEDNAAKGTIIDGRDIREVDPVGVLKTLKIKAGDLDVLDGSPPCSSFSMAGRRDEHWGASKQYSDTEQRTDDLFFEFIRILRGFMPKVFVAENVSGLVKGTAKGAFLEILAEMKLAGYRVNARLLDAQWLGVPQQRQRLIFVGVREDLKRDPVHPEPLPYRYSVRDALPVRCHVEPETDISKYAIGEEYDQIDASVKKGRFGTQSDRFFQLRKPALGDPSFAITAEGGSPSIASVVHPTEKRKFAIAELKRICGFPDDFKLSGTYQQKWERLGRAVPPVMMKAIAETIRDRIFTPSLEH